MDSAGSAVGGVNSHSLAHLMLTFSMLKSEFLVLTKFPETLWWRHAGQAFLSFWVQYLFLIEPSLSPPFSP